MNYQEDDLYQTIGLPNLLAGRNAPDIYFEWTGARMAQRDADGYAADLTEAVQSGPLAGLMRRGAARRRVPIDGKVVLVPHTADVTNVLWFNVPTLRGATASSRRRPGTSCWPRATRSSPRASSPSRPATRTSGPPATGSPTWPRASSARTPTTTVLSGKGKFSTPEWEQAFGYIEELADHKCVNDSANAIDDNAGAQLFFQGKAAMHPIGSWLV